jgi:hypothetical protein
MDQDDFDQRDGIVTLPAKRNGRAYVVEIHQTDGSTKKISI